MKPIKIRLVPQLAPAKKLSTELADLRARVAQRAVTIREVLQALRGRAYMLLVILLTLPFLLPLPLPGLSTPFGFAIILICFRLALGQRPWLPKSIQRRLLPAGFIPRLLDLAEKIIRRLESILKPCWLVLTEHALIRQLHAIVMVAGASILLLPLPIPLSNGLPAWSILLLACGLLERDGRAIALGYLMFVLSIIYLWFFGEAVYHTIELLLVRWQNWYRDERTFARGILAYQELFWWSHLAATCAMAGCLWVVQLAIYPLFAVIGAAEFGDYHRRYMTRITFVVGPLMAVEGITASALWLGGQHSVLFSVTLVLLALSWLSTFVWQVPLHKKLMIQFSPTVHQQLVRSNWFRTLAWTLRASGLVWLSW